VINKWIINNFFRIVNRELDIRCKNNSLLIYDIDQSFIGGKTDVIAGSGDKAYLFILSIYRIYIF
jgi:hypothetical protein